LLTLLAEASGLLGQPEGGLGALEEALILVEQTGERYYEAELHRQRGELLLLHAAKNHPDQGYGGDVFVARTNKPMLAMDLDFFGTNRRGKRVGLVEVVL
jgi:hypothetical protein